MEKEKLLVKEEILKKFEKYLIERENARATIEKYVRDTGKFLDYLGEREVTKELLMAYKTCLMEEYAASSVNSMLVALNQFLLFIEMGKLKLKRIRVQRVFGMEEEKELSKEEYMLLLKTAREEGKGQLALIMETICSTGIRVSELKFFRVENIKNGIIKIWNKGKYRLVILPSMLQKKLEAYILRNKIRKGCIFVTRNHREKNRSNIWKEMKRLAKAAGIEENKIFPHNLRHLFARTFYKVTKNLLVLADILGHSSLDVTRIYASEGIKEWKKCVESLDLLRE